MENHKSYAVSGMHCASCAATIEKTLKKIPGVTSAEVNYGTETAKLAFDEKETSVHHLSKAIEPLGYTLKEPTAEEMGMLVSEHAAHLGLGQTREQRLVELTNMRRSLMAALPIVVASIFVMIWEIGAEFAILPGTPEIWKEFFHHLLPILATGIFFMLGKPYLLGVYRFLRYGTANMDTLIGIGTLAAFIYSFIISAFEDSLRAFINVEQMYYDVTIVVITFIALGKYLETASKLKTGDAIEKLLNLQAKSALVQRGGKEIELSLDQVVVGDLVVVKPAGRIPVDGVLIDGESYVDEAMVTGEPIPVKKEMGSVVVAGTMNTSGSFVFRATRVGSETLLASIIKMVQEAQGSKAPIQALADKISSVFVPIVLVIACVSLAVWLIVGAQYLGFAQALSYGLVSFVGVLVIACPCALGLATPTAIIVGVGKGAQEGILIKDASTLEKLYKVTTVVMDKTGTLTVGKPQVTSIQNFSKNSDDQVMAILAALEGKSEHPIAHAISEYAREKKYTLSEVKKFEAIKGMGVFGEVGGVEYYAGNTALIRQLKLSFDDSFLNGEVEKGHTPILLASKSAVVAVIMAADAVKPIAVEAIRRLHELGIETVMLTGDNKKTAGYIAGVVGIDTVVAEALPETKLAIIKDLQAKGKVVAMAGDGVNDAPALAQADVGIAMATGTDVAIESAGITLLHGDISKLVKAVHLSQLTMRGIKQNLFWAFAYNVVGIPLAAGVFYPVFGWLLSPVFAGFAMALSSVSVVGNSLRIKAKQL